MDRVERVFDGEYVAAARAIAVVQHRGKRGRFSGSCCADHKHESTFLHHDRFEMARQAEGPQTGNAVRDIACDERGLAFLLIHIETKASGRRQMR